MNSKVAGENGQPTPRVAEMWVDVNIHMIRHVRNALREVGGPASYWIGPETLVDLTIEDRDVITLVDSGSQVKTIMLALVQQYGFPVLLLEDLVDYPLNLVGLILLGFIILHVQVWEIAGYDEDIVFLVVPNESEFSRRVPLVIGTSTISRIINVFQESEIDHLSTPWLLQGWPSCFPAGRTTPLQYWTGWNLSPTVPLGGPGKWRWMNWSW